MTQNLLRSRRVDNACCELLFAGVSKVKRGPGIARAAGAMHLYDTRRTKHGRESPVSGTSSERGGVAHCASRRSLAGQEKGRAATRTGRGRCSNQALRASQRDQRCHRCGNAASAALRASQRDQRCPENNSWRAEGVASPNVE